MNERIQELADEAGLKYHNWITNESNVKDGDFKYPRLEDYEKFAELIVRECADMLMLEHAEAKGQHNYYHVTANKLKKYFGVEE